MAAISGITAVRPTSNTSISGPVQYGATISAGQGVYLDSTDNKYKLADSNLSAAAATVRGVAMTPGIADGYGMIATAGGVILVGTTLAVGESYYAGATAGEIVPDGDLSTGHFVSRIGVASTTTQLNISIDNTGITHP